MPVFQWQLQSGSSLSCNWWKFGNTLLTVQCSSSVIHRNIAKLAKHECQYLAQPNHVRVKRTYHVTRIISAVFNNERHCPNNVDIHHNTIMSLTLDYASNKLRHLAILWILMNNLEQNWFRIRNKFSLPRNPNQIHLTVNHLPRCLNR